MSERRLRIVLALFVVLSGAVSMNLLLLQPTGASVKGATLAGAVSETAALAAPEIDNRSNSEMPGQRAVAVPSQFGQRLIVEPPTSDARETVKAIQQALQARGYETGGQDGIAGPVTRAAILAFEADHGLTLTAEPAPELLKAILDGRNGSGRAAGGPSAPQPRAEQLILSVQQSLQKLGYTTSKADGRLGESTIAAIRQFEKQQNMPDTGRISGELMVRLSLLASRSSTAQKR